MPYDVIFMDIDNTLLDFNAGTREALTNLLARYGRELTPQDEAQFHTINNQLWTAYEHGEIPKSAIFEQRFARFLGLFGIETDPLEANAAYAKWLSESAVFMPHAKELLDTLHGKYRLIGVTNGVVTTQIPRLKKAGLDQYLEQNFISEAMGCKKPEKEFFDQVFAAIGPVDKSRCIILGDSLTSDMQGGRNAGIATCYLGEDKNDPRCDYVIADLLDLLPILEQ
jgi:2-haloacid dehalogenase